jgi:hypothetical protein
MANHATRTSNDTACVTGRGNGRNNARIFRYGYRHPAAAALVGRTGDVGTGDSGTGDVTDALAAQFESLDYERVRPGIDERFDGRFDS